MKAHSGWAALVVVGRTRDGDVLVDRRRLELVEEERGKQPYHAAENLKPEAARRLVERSAEAARRCASRELAAVVKREGERGNEVAGCSVLVGAPMPGWSVAEILAVHFRMHKAEGAMFKDALVAASEECGLKVVGVPEKSVISRAEEALGEPPAALMKRLTTLGKPAGPPWGKDQKDAALAALIALKGR